MKRLYAYIIPIIFLCASCTSRDRYITFTGYAQGGTYTVKLNLKGVSEKPTVIRDSVDALLNQIDFSLSGYNKGSIRLSQTAFFWIYIPTHIEYMV